MALIGNLLVSIVAGGPIMPKHDDFFDTVRMFEGSLGKWQSDVARANIRGKHAKAAEIHVRRAKDWIKTILENPDHATAGKDTDIIAKLENAVIVLKDAKAETPHGLVDAGGTIDKALQSTYDAIKISVGKKGTADAGFTLAEPPSYEKTLSFLPGDSDFPTAEFLPGYSGSLPGETDYTADVRPSDQSATRGDTDHSAKKRTSRKR